MTARVFMWDVGEWEVSLSLLSFSLSELSLTGSSVLWICWVATCQTEALLPSSKKRQLLTTWWDTAQYCSRCPVTLQCCQRCEADITVETTFPPIKAEAFIDSSSFSEIFFYINFIIILYVSVSIRNWYLINEASLAEHILVEASLADTEFFLRKYSSCELRGVACFSCQYLITPDFNSSATVRPTFVSSEMFSQPVDSGLSFGPEVMKWWTKIAKKLNIIPA